MSLFLRLAILVLASYLLINVYVLDSGDERRVITVIGTPDGDGPEPNQAPEDEGVSSPFLQVGGVEVPSAISSQDQVPGIRAAFEAATAEDVAVLREAARSATDPIIAAYAIRALGRLGRFQADDPLTVALEDPRPRVRQEAVRALGVTGDPAARLFLEPLLQAEDETTRHLAIQALGELGTEEARALLEGFKPTTDVERAFKRAALER